MLSYVTVAIACLYMIIFMNQYHCDDFKRFFVAHGENPDQYDKICKDIYSGESFRAADWFDPNEIIYSQYSAILSSSSWWFRRYSFGSLIYALAQLSL